MTVDEKQRSLVERLAIIADPHERLAVLVSRAPALGSLAANEHTEGNLVRGCVSQVWVAGGVEGGVCRFRTDADSPMVKGLVALLCEIYDGAMPADVIATEPTIFETLGLTRMLSATRLHGLDRVRTRIREMARSLSADD